MSSTSEVQHYLKSLTVLYVEDEEASRELAAEFLARCVGRLVTAHNGAEGLAAWQSHHPDIVITDIWMPVMDGLTMMQEIRAQDTMVPIIVLSAFEDPASLKRSINLGVSGYVIKPIDTTQFNTTLFECARRLLVEHKLRCSEKSVTDANEILEAVIENLADWVWEVDGEWRYTYCSPQVETFLGYTPAEIIGTSFFDFMPPEEAAVVRSQFAELYRHKLRIQNLENWNTGKGGHRILLSTSAIPIPDAAGALRGYRGVNKDITEFKRYEAELRKMSRAVEQSPVTIVITDTQGTIEFVNPKFTELTGFSAEEAIGRNPRILSSGKTPPETFCELWRTITSGKTWEGELLNRGKDGSLFWEWAAISPLLDENGTITQFLGVKEDITEKKMVMEQLITAKNLAEAGTRAKSDFLSTMSHEIRTPMNGVIGMTGLLLDTDLSSEQRDYAEIVHKSGENLMSIINEILDFSKIEAGKIDLELLPFDLRATLEDTTEMFAAQAKEAGLELVCTIGPDVPSFLKGDPGRLRQVIINLVGNAIKFTRHGSVSVRTSLASDQDGCATLLFEIQDTGIGIPAERLDFIFVPFTQADASTTRQYGGTGLGLTICKQLVELMAGKIGVTSEVDKGSRFWFTARFEIDEAPFVEPHDTASVPPGDGIDSKILVVDENAANRKVVTALLNQWGCRYETACDSESALILLRQAAHKNSPFRVALLDQQMPDSDGRELGRRIKADALLESTVLIMVTSSDQLDVAVLDQIGFSGYLVKPVLQAPLHDCLKLVLGYGNPASEVSSSGYGIVTRNVGAENTRRKIRILLAEDNIINQKVAQNLLNKLGLKADVVANGREALKSLEMINYDLVLMDCMMPEMDGFEATASIRDPASKVKNHHVPIIAMTANAMKGDREKCLEIGMDAYLAKPVKKSELAEVLERWCGGAVSTDPVA
jgi:PAS domain S-box-containing protein